MRAGSRRRRRSGLAYLNNNGVLFIVWDEGENTPKVPFLALGPKVEQGHSSKVTYSHASLVKSIRNESGEGARKPQLLGQTPQAAEQLARMAASCAAV